MMTATATPDERATPLFVPAPDRLPDRLPDRFSAQIATVAPIGLAELEDAAALRTRRDRKYIVPTAVAAVLVEQLARASRVLEIGERRSFRYESVYFDAPGRDSYLAAARWRPGRYKVRTRSYLDAGRSLVEVKVRDPRGNTVKDRVDHPLALRDRLTGRRAHSWPTMGRSAGPASWLAPALTTRYNRTTLLLPADGARLTLDTGVEAIAPDGCRALLAGMVIVETKSPGAPSVADRILWTHGYRPTRVSKFGTGLAVLRPELPANKWTRALRQPWVIQSGRVDQDPAVARDGAA